MAFLLALGAGAAGIFMEQKNEVNNTIVEDIKQTITSVMETEVDGRARADCQNIISLKDLECCVVTIDSQICTAKAVSDVSSDTQFLSDVTQKLASQTLQQSTVENKGGWANNTNIVNNFTKKTIDVAVQSTQSFKTICSKEATGLNVTEIKNAYCGRLADGSCQKKDRPDFEVKLQQSSVEAMGSCVAKQVGSTTVASELASMTGQITEAKNTGIDMIAYALFILSFGIAFLCIPIGYKIYKKAQAGAYGPPLTREQFMEQQAQKQRQRSGMIMALASFFVLVLWLAFLWPGLLSVLLGITPHSKQPIQKRFLCKDGELRDEVRLVNRFMWWDENCLTNFDDNGNPLPCDPRSKVKSYSTCGVFAKERGCRDPRLEADKQRYLAMQQACSAVSLYSNLPNFDVCNAESIANVTLPSSVSMCRRCDRPGDDASLFGLFASLKTDLSDACRRAVADKGEIPDECFNACTRDKFSLDRYFPGVGEDNTPLVCAAGDDACVANEAVYKSMFPNECSAPSYMDRKKNFVEGVKACAKVNENYCSNGVCGSGEPVSLRSVCPPPVFNYMDCNRNSFQCNYQAADQTDEIEKKACANDFEGCDDVQYVRDKIVEEAQEETCRKDAEVMASYDRMRFWVPATSLVVIIVLVVVLAIGLAKVASSGPSKPPAQNIVPTPPQKPTLLPAPTNQPLTPPTSST